MNRTIAAALGALALAGAPCLAAGNVARYGLDAGSTLWLQGDSTLHGFKSTATVMKASAEMEGSQGKSFALTIDVKGLESGERKLDKNLQAAMKADEFPVITFRMERFERQDARVLAFGKLSIAGVEKERTIEAKLQSSQAGWELIGEHKLRMSEFGVKPPTLFLGTLKVRDPVVIHFDLKLKESQP